MKTSNTIQPVLYFGALCERDIDLLILEEAYSSPAFLNFLIESANIDTSTVRLIEARVSSIESTGESDIEIWIQHAEQEISALLIENKIHASFQVDQVQRYRNRGDRYLREQRLSSYRTILVAPEKYLSGAGAAADFDVKVSYESIRDILATNPGQLPESRISFKVMQLDRAIEKARFGYSRIEDATVSSFWKDYRKLLSSIAPELEMPEREGRPARALWARFKVPGYKGKFAVVHKLNKGKVDFQMPKHGKDRASVYKYLLPFSEKEMAITTAGQSLVVRLKAPIVHVERPFDEQHEAISQGILLTKVMFDWARANASEVRAILEKDRSSDKIAIAIDQ